MPVDPRTGQPLPYPDEEMGVPPDPALMGGPPEAAMLGAPPPPGATAPGEGGFPSLEPGALAAIAMQVIAEVAGVDQQKVQALLAQQAQMFAQQQQAALAGAPDAIAAIIGQLGLAGPPPETLDEAAGAMPPPPAPMGAPMAPEEEMMMAQGAPV